jgi:hypothetical protein
MSPCPALTRRKRQPSQQAVEEAIRRKTEHVIHNQDGTIGERTLSARELLWRRSSRPEGTSRRAVRNDGFRDGLPSGWGAPLGGPQFGRALPHWVTALTYHTGPYSLPAPFSRPPQRGCTGFSHFARSLILAAKRLGD